MKTKVCTKCKKEKLLSEFYKDRFSKSGIRSWCKKCTKESRQKWYQKNLKCQRKKARERGRKNKKERRNYHLMRKFGLTPERHFQMYMNQNGRCAICNKAVPYNKVDTDHDHKTGKICGLLCRSCNLKVEVLRDDEFIRKTKKYFADCS